MPRYYIFFQYNFKTIFNAIHYGIFAVSYIRIHKLTDACDICDLKFWSIVKYQIYWKTTLLQDY